MRGANMAAKKTSISKMSFEDALEELESIVRDLESGSSKLDESIDSYERGAALQKHCEEKLRSAQTRIDKISLGRDGQPVITPADIETS